MLPSRWTCDNVCQIARALSLHSCARLRQIMYNCWMHAENSVKRPALPSCKIAIRWGMSALALFFLVACARDSNYYLERATGDSAASESFLSQPIATKDFRLASLRRVNQPGKLMRVYIEGDGKAWISRYRVSANPTPDTPVGLHMALADQSANVVYIARPCQFVKLNSQPSCTPEIWSIDRYSTRVVENYISALDAISRQYDNAKLELVGFSGGATIAMLAGRRLASVVNIRTIAGNLDTAQFAMQHGIAFSSSSLNPAALAAEISGIPQIHFIGTRDRIVTEEISASYMRQLSDKKCASVVEANASHLDGWIEQWPELLDRIPACKRPRVEK